MNLALKGKRVLVTGGSRGIGRSIALAFAAEGARVAFTYRRDAEMAEETVARAGGAATAIQLDLGSEASIEAAVGALRERMGGADVVVHNAVAWPGFPQPGELFEAAPPARFRDSLRTNLAAC